MLDYNYMWDNVILHIRDKEITTDIDVNAFCGGGTYGFDLEKAYITMVYHYKLSINNDADFISKTYLVPIKDKREFDISNIEYIHKNHKELILEYIRLHIEKMFMLREYSNLISVAAESLKMVEETSPHFVKL